MTKQANPPVARSLLHVGCGPMWRSGATPWLVMMALGVAAVSA